MQHIVTVDRAMSEIFDQYTFEHHLLTKMIADLPGGPEVYFNHIYHAAFHFQCCRRWCHQRLIDFGDCLIFANDEGIDAVILDYTVEYDNVLDDYIRLGEEDFYAHFDPSNSFPPTLSEYQYVDMSVQLVVTADKARSDIFD